MVLHVHVSFKCTVAGCNLCLTESNFLHLVQTTNTGTCTKPQLHWLAVQGIYDKRQRTEHEMVHREQEIKQLQGWAQTVLNLINKFEDGLKELGPLAAIEEAEGRPASPDEEAHVDEEVPTAVATARALTDRARDLTAHRQGIAKLRQHFSKVQSA